MTRTSLILIALTAALPAHADLFVAGRLPSAQQSLSVFRVRESDGALIGPRLSIGGESIDGITVGNDNRLYAVINTLGDGMLTKGDPINGGFALPLTTWRQDGFAGPGGAAAGDGVVYSTSRHFDSPGIGVPGVFKFDGNTGATLGIPILPGDHSLDVPIDVLRMPGGDLLVRDAQRFNRYDWYTNAFVSTFLAPGAGGLGTQILGTTFGPDGNFYVADYNNNRILRFDGNSGAPLGVFGSVLRPLQTAFGADGNLYVGSDFNQAIVRMDGITGANAGSFIPGASQQFGWTGGLLSAPEVPEPGVALVPLALLAVRRSHRHRRGT